MSADFTGATWALWSGAKKHYTFYGEQSGKDPEAFHCRNCFGECESNNPTRPCDLI